MEGGWALLLVLASLDRRTRPLAVLMALKWWGCYVAFGVAEWAPALVDVVLGVKLVWMARRYRYEPWSRIIVVGCVVTCLCHSLYWMLWEARLSGGELGARIYFLSVVGIYTAQLLGLAMPGVRRFVGTTVHFLGVIGWGGSADPAGNPRARRRKNARAG